MTRGVAQVARLRIHVKIQERSPQQVIDRTWQAALSAYRGARCLVVVIEDDPKQKGGHMRRRSFRGKLTDITSHGVAIQYRNAQFAEYISYSDLFTGHAAIAVEPLAREKIS